jgi:predicted solute-binding protein
MCARVFNITPTLENHGPDIEAMLSRCEAALIIGDKALFQHGGPLTVGSGADRRDVQVEKIDLGELWLETTGLPFVYAFWAGRPGVVSPDDVRILQETRDASLRNVRAISEFYFPGDAARQDVSDRYLQDNIKYRLGPDERAGLERFYRYAAEAGVVPRAVTPAFFDNPN